MLRKILIGLGVVVVLLVALVGFLYVKGSSYIGSKPAAPLPTIQAATTPEAIERGKTIFRAVCEDCHRQDSSGRVAGGQLKGVPAFFGKFHASNLTSHPEAGIGSAKDEELARVIRYGVRRTDGSPIIVMGHSGMSDEDLSAVLGFMRSQDPLFAPDDRKQPGPQVAFLGNVILALSGEPPPLSRPASGLTAPAKGPSVEYGRYLARDVYECAGCHTPGFNASKIDGPKAFTGGFEYQEKKGVKIYSTNLTFHETGLAGWTLEDFKRSMREGIGPTGYVSRPPMRRFRGMDDVEAEALYKFFESLPKMDAPTPQATEPRVKATAKAPEQLFTELGCAVCHAEGQKFRDMLKRSMGKPSSEVARWILDPESFSPGTQMPSYRQVLDEQQAQSLATWVQQHAASIP